MAAFGFSFCQILYTVVLYLHLPSTTHPFDRVAMVRPQVRVLLAGTLEASVDASSSTWCREGCFLTLELEKKVAGRPEVLDTWAL